MTGSELLETLYRSAEANQFASFEGSLDERIVDVAIIKEYLLKSSSPLRIEGAIIRGDLHLENAVQQGDAALPAIFLHHCELHGSLYLSGAKIKHLSLQRSTFKQLDIVTATILGDLDCSNVAPFVLDDTRDRKSDDSAKDTTDGEDHDKPSEGTARAPLEEPAYILGRGVRIAGDLILRGARLRALEMRQKSDVAETEDKRWAAQLNGSHIEGSIHANDCTAYGGVHLGSARVHGDVWCYGLDCTATEANAIRMQTASIAGALRFDRCVIRGQVHLLGANIGALIFSKGTFYPDEEGSCISAAGITVSGNVIFDAGFETVGGTINFDQAHIKGSLHCQGCKLKGAELTSSKRKALFGAICFSAQGAAVGGDLLFQGTDDRELTVDGAVGFQGIRIGGEVSIRSARVRCTSGDLPPCAVFLNDAHVGGGVSFGPKLELRGSMMLDLTEIGGNLSVSNSVVTMLLRTQQTEANRTEGEEIEKTWFELVFSAISLKVAGSVAFEGTRNKPRKSEAKTESTSIKKSISSCRVLGVLSFAGSEIGHDFIFRSTDFENSQKLEPRAVDLTGCRIGGLLQVDQCTFRGGLKLTFSRVAGTLQVIGSSLTPARGGGRPGFALNLESARIDGSVSLYNSSFGGIVILDFARIDGPLHVVQSTLIEGSSRTRENENRNAALRARSAEIRGELVIGELESSSLHEAESRGAREMSERVTITGLIDLSRSQVGSRFRLAGCTLRPGDNSPVSLQAEQLIVVGSIDIEDTHFLGSVEARHMTVRTNLSWANVNFGRAAVSFDLQHIKIEGVLKAESLTHEGPLVIDLSSGSTGSLNDNLGEFDRSTKYSINSGWGRVEDNVPELKINLQGFVYQTTCDQYSREEGKPWLLRTFGNDLPRKFRLRLHWLSQSDDDRHDAPAHHPQPYRRYSAVLRSHGFDALSRKVAAKDGWKEFHSERKRANLFGNIWLWLIKFPFGYFFGFGYQPVRAIGTMFFLLVIGMCFAAKAADRGILVLSSPSAAAIPAAPLGTEYSGIVKGSTSNTPLLSSGTPRNAGLSSIEAAAATNRVVTHRLTNQPTASCIFMSPQRSHSPVHAWMSDLFYAVNLALPIVQLHEKTECEIASSASATDDQRSNELNNWHYIENGYSIVAKLFTTLALITFSGVLRRSE